MAYVINVSHHGLPYGELLTRIFHAFEVPLNDKEAEQHKETDKFEETFLNICGLKREDANKRRDEVEDEGESEEEIVEEEDGNSDSEKIEQVEKEAEVEGEQLDHEEKPAKAAGSESVEEFFNAMDEGQDVGEDVTTPATQPVKQKGKSTTRGVDPSGTNPDYDLLHLQVEMHRALQANKRFQELFQKIKPNPPTSPKP
ncbi:hypothetical protein Dimus_017852 [Dionaea muscipula]